MIGIGLWVTRPGTAVPAALLGTMGVRYRCLYGVQSRIQQIAFPAVKDVAGGADISLAASSIVVKKLPLERIYKRADSPLALPCIIITPQRSGASPTEGVTDRDDYRRPCLVTMVMKDNAEPTLALNMDIMDLWQEKIEHAFHNQRLPGVSEVVIGYAEPAEAVIPQAWGHNVLASAVMLRFLCRESRGLT